MNFLLALTLLLSPAYVVKFNLFNFPTNLLMIWVVLVWVIFAVWIVGKHRLKDFWHAVTSLDKKIAAMVGLFFIAGVVSTFVGGFGRAKLGQFIVLFLQPISLFFIGRYIISKFPRASALLLTTSYLLLTIAGLYAIIQYLTLIGVPPAWWGNSNEPKRALSFFVHPNFYALWSAPLLAFLIPDVGHQLGVILRAQLSNTPAAEESHNWNEEILRSVQDDAKKRWSFIKIVAWFIGAIGLFLSLSRAGWLGLAAAVGVYLIFAADKKIRKLAFASVVVGVIVIVSIPNFRYRLLLPFYREKSTVSRYSLWNTGWKGIKESPITGLGLTGFSRQWDTLNTDKGLTEHHNFPHNIFLDLWVETGIIGLISLIGLIGLAIHRGIKNRNHTIALGVSLFVIALLTQGLIDNPYFKNDLAMVFWIILCLYEYPNQKT